MQKRCEKCELHKGSSKQFFRELKPTAKLVVVLQSPDNLSLDLDYLAQWTKQFKFNGDYIYATTLLKCFKQDAKAQEYEICFDENLIDEISALTECKVILVMGAQTVKTVIGINDKLSDIIGTLYTKGKYELLATYPPSYLKHNPSSENLIKRSFETAYKIAVGEELEEVETVELKTVQVKTYDQLLYLYEKLMSEPLWAFDLETKGVSFVKDNIIGCSFSWSKTEGWYLPIQEYEGFSGLGWSDYVLSDDESGINLRNFLLDVLLNSPAKKIAQNAKFEIEHIGFDLETEIHVDHDTQVLHYLLNSHVAKHSLESISEIYPQFMGYKQTIKDFKTLGGWERIDIETIAAYGAKDSILTYTYFVDHYDQMPEKMREIAYNQILMPLVHLYAEMEKNGLYIDLKHIEKLDDVLTTEVEVKTQEIMNLAGYELNPSSTDDIRDFLYNKLKIPTKGIKKTVKGHSTDKATLEYLVETYDHPGLTAIVDYRKALKAHSSYVKHFQEYCRPDGLYHPNWKLTRAVTGRSASGSDEESDKSINMQNIPVRDDRFKIKHLFIAPSGFYFGGVDYSQIEMRILAEVTQDLELLRAFAEDFDIHSFVCSAYSQVPYEVIVAKKNIDEVFKNMRRDAKTIGFGWVYGAHDGKFKSIFKTLEAEIKAKRNYFAKFSSILPWKEEVLSEFRNTGEITTIMGFRRKIPDILTKGLPPYRYEKAEREAINTLIQNPAAFYLNRSAKAVNDTFKKVGSKSRMVNSIHDAAYYYIEKDSFNESIDIIKEVMLEPRFDIKVKMGIEIEVWEDCWNGKRIFQWEGSSVS